MWLGEHSLRSLEGACLALHARASALQQMQPTACKSILHDSLVCWPVSNPTLVLHLVYRARHQAMRSGFGRCLPVMVAARLRPLNLSHCNCSAVRPVSNIHKTQGYLTNQINAWLLSKTTALWLQPPGSPLRTSDSVIPSRICQMPLD